MYFYFESMTLVQKNNEKRLQCDIICKHKLSSNFILPGDTQVYTVGTVGRTKVVSTKLSRTPGSAQAAIISAENTVTRLLGKSLNIRAQLFQTNDVVS